MLHSELMIAAIIVGKKINRSGHNRDIEGIMELLGSKFCAMAKRRHAGQLIENSMASLRRQVTLGE